MRTMCAVGTVLGLVLATHAIAQEGQQEEEKRQALRNLRTQPKLCLASKIHGMAVQDNKDEKCGTIQDMAIDTSGRVRYVAIATQGEAGEANAADRSKARQNQNPDRQSADRASHNPNEQLTLVPFELLRIPEATPDQQDKSQNVVKLQIEKARLMEAPTFTRSQLETIPQQTQLISKVDTFFKRETGAAARPELNRPRDREREQEDE